MVAWEEATILPTPRTTTNGMTTTTVQFELAVKEASLVREPISSSTRGEID